MEPTVDVGFHKEQEIGFLDISMTDWSVTKSYDNLSHTATGTPTPWIMLPQSEVREISVWHNVGATGTLYLQAAGEGFESASLFEVDASTPFQVSSNKVGDKGFLRVGIGNAGETTPLMTPADQSDLTQDYQHLVRFTVKEKKQLLVVVHPIGLATLGGNGNVQPGLSPQFLPSRTEIENYLNDVFETQANIHVTVEMRAENHLQWDVGMGPSVPDETTRGAGDGILDCYFSAHENQCGGKVHFRA